jgi:hypothetical protein
MWSLFRKFVAINSNKTTKMVSAGSTHINYCIDVQGVGEIIPYSNAPNKGQEQVQFNPSLNQTTNKLMPFNNSTVVTPVSYKTLNILLEGYQDTGRQILNYLIAWLPWVLHSLDETRI